MNEVLQIPAWMVAGAVFLYGAAWVGMLFWHGNIATEQAERDIELDERTAQLSEIEGEQVSRSIRRAWDVALPFDKDEVA